MQHVLFRSVFLFFLEYVSFRLVVRCVEDTSSMDVMAHPLWSLSIQASFGLPAYLFRRLDLIRVFSYLPIWIASKQRITIFKTAN
jgi:hypothetical protein